MILYTPKLLSRKTFAVFNDFAFNRDRKFLLNKIFHKFHARHDDKALGNRESFPMNAHLHTNHESFPT